MSDTAAAIGAELPAVQLMPQDRQARTRPSALLSLILSIAVLAAVIQASGRVELARLPDMIPSSPLFWAVFVASYLVTPASEWLIFRRLWGIPASGMLPLLRKKIYNELLLGYLGEAYFYAWARRRVTLSAAPFGAVKDVAILSAMVGNAVTLVLLAVMLPILGSAPLGIDPRLLTTSLAIILAICAATMIWRRRVFTLPRADLAMITRMHLARIVLSTGLSALTWHLVLPAVGLSWWFLLATLRMLVSRLPLVPNKDLLFAGITVVVLGQQREIGALMALMAGLILATHLLLGSAIALHDLVRNMEKRA